jgi:putative acetyltransferase
MARNIEVTYIEEGAVRIEIDNLSRKEVHDLLREHLENMRAITPPGSVHALDLERLRAPEITFWTAWDEGDGGLLGCAALKSWGAEFGEVKSMRTPAARRRQGAGRVLLAHVIAEARGRGYQRLHLETGAAEGFRPARALYESFGFVYGEPFGDYKPDPNSVFMWLAL